MESPDIVAGEERFDRLRLPGRRLHDDRHFVVFRQVVDQDIEHESIELGFGQRIGALHFDRVLRRQHEERLFQRIAHAAGRDLMFLHGFQQRRLRLGRRAVDFVGQDHVGEDRAFDELQFAMAVGRLFQNFGAGDVGRHQVRRELDAMKFQMEDLARRADQQGFRQPGGTGDQAMPAGKQADQQLGRDFLLADDDFGQLGVDPIATFTQLFHRLLLHFKCFNSADTVLPPVGSSWCRTRTECSRQRYVCVSISERRGANTLARVTVGRFQPVARQTRPECPRCKLFEPLMSHGVGHDIDSHRVRLLLGDNCESTTRRHAFAFPTVTQIGVMADEHNHAAIVIIPGSIVRTSRASGPFIAVSRLPHARSTETWGRSLRS